MSLTGYEIKNLLLEAHQDFLKQKEKIIGRYVNYKTMFDHKFVIYPDGHSVLFNKKTKKDIIEFMPVEFRKIDECKYEIVQQYRICKEEK